MEEMNFDDIRKQIAMLKSKLDNQEIINERLMRQTFKSQARKIHYTARMCYMSALMCLLLYPVIYYTEVASGAFCLATCLMMLFCIVATYYIHRPVNSTDLMTADVATVATVMARFKRQYDNWLHYVTPILIIFWMPWATYEMALRKAPEGSNPYILALPLIVGGIIGAVIGYRYHRKATNAAQAILDQINNE